MNWADTHTVSVVMGIFGEKLGASRKTYRPLLKKGVAEGRCPDITSGCLLRSAGGGERVKALMEEKVLKVKGSIF
jgi:hypothetical protein